jgi:hypothetical protein
VMLWVGHAADKPRARPTEEARASRRPTAVETEGSGRAGTPVRLRASKHRV